MTHSLRIVTLAKTAQDLEDGQRILILSSVCSSRKDFTEKLLLLACKPGNIKVYGNIKSQKVNLFM